MLLRCRPSSNHGETAFEHEHTVRVHLHHGGFDLGHECPFELDEEPLQSDARLIKHDAVGTDLQFNTLHGLCGALAQVESSGLVAHLEGQRVVAHIDLDVAVMGDLDGLVVLHCEAVVVFDHTRKVFPGCT